MKTIEERINDPKIIPELEKVFKAFWGDDIPFQYVDNGLDYEADCYDDKIGAWRKMTDREIIEYFEDELIDIHYPIDSPTLYVCENCKRNELDENYITERYPETDKITEEKIMNWCEECQDNYIRKMNHNY